MQASHPVEICKEGLLVLEKKGGMRGEGKSWQLGVLGRKGRGRAEEQGCRKQMHWRCRDGLQSGDGREGGAK